MEKGMFSDEEIKEAFDAFDINNNHFISGEEIRIVMDGIGEYVTDEEIEEMIRMVDFENKGRVGYEGFYKMATGQPLAPIGIAHPPSSKFQMAEPHDQLDKVSVTSKRSADEPKLPELPLSKKIRTFNIDSKISSLKLNKVNDAPYHVSVRKKHLNTPSQPSSKRFESLSQSPISRSGIVEGETGKPPVIPSKRQGLKQWKAVGEEEDNHSSIVVSSEDPSLHR